MAKLLLDESPLIVLPSLAKEIGLNEAIVLQQLHYWLQNKRAGKDTANYKEGRWWVYNTYQQWREDAFIFWSEITIQRIFLGLEKSGLVIGKCLHADPKNRTKWYTIDYVRYGELVEAKVEAREAQRDAELTALVEEFPADVVLKPAAPTGADTTISSCDGASYQVDMMQDIKLTPSTASSCHDAPHQIDAVYRTKTSPKISAKNSTAKTQNSPALSAKPAAAPVDPAAAGLIASLIEAEVNSADAERLALEKPDECRRQLAFLPFVEKFKSSKGAYLRSAIEGGFGPPAGWKEAQKRQEVGQKRLREAQMNATKKEAEAARLAALDAEKARLQAESPEAWDALVSLAELGVPAPIRSRPDGPAYKPALDARINALLAERTTAGGMGSSIGAGQ